MDDLKLVELKGIVRFIPSDVPCPKCGQPALEDRWPPNYWEGHSTGTLGGDEITSEDYTLGGQKHICLPCRISFRAHRRTRRKGFDVVSDETKITDVVPLVERDGHLLAPHDVEREDYKAKHGKYPREAYA